MIAREHHPQRLHPSYHSGGLSYEHVYLATEERNALRYVLPCLAVRNKVNVRIISTVGQFRSESI